MFDMWDSALLLLFADWGVRIFFSFLVIMSRRSVGESLAWLTIILVVPFAGAIFYLLLGEVRIHNRRARWASHLEHQQAAWLARQRPYIKTDWNAADQDPELLAKLVTASVNIPPLTGNHIELIDNAEAIFHSMIRAIEQAQARCWVESYIWEVGGTADDVVQALASAARRGVDCRVLVDAVGSRGFLRSQLCAGLRNAGVQVRQALPVGLLRAFFYRLDLRLHRKLLIVDHEIAFVGSQNMADPKSFKRGAGVGQWIDAMAQLSGPAVDPISLIFLEDWQLESMSNVDIPASEFGNGNVPSDVGTTIVQVIPSGPETQSQVMERIVLNAIYMADRSLSITTPYLVPSEAMQTAILSATGRGVAVRIIIPAKVDSWLVELASRTFLSELAAAGVMIARYQPGMLHTKSIIIDDDTSLFGSLNLDPRSMNLNFEITLAVFDRHFSHQLSELHNKYLATSVVVNKELQTVPRLPRRFLENCVRLISPLL
jgi:cardiolipin synthase A/B